jgi:predicted transcriptional regulator
MANEGGATDLSERELLRLSADIVAAYLAENSLPAAQIPDLVRSVHATLCTLGGAEPAAAMRSSDKQKPAVPVSKSIQDDYIVCLEDGKQLKMLKRYLRSRFDLSPEDYKRKWGLPADYPMVAPSYAQRRSDFAKQIGLGKGVRHKA